MNRLKDILVQRWRVFVRFPMASIMGFAIAVLAMLLNHNVWDYMNPANEKIGYGIMTLATFLPLAILIPIGIEWSMTKRTVLYKNSLYSILLILGGFFYRYLASHSTYDTVPSWTMPMDTYYYGYTTIMTWLGLFAAVVYFYKNDRDGYREWCRFVCTKLLISVVSGMILFLGVSASLASLDYLFNITIQSELYADIWVTSITIIALALFMHVLPSKVPPKAEIHYLPLFSFFGKYIFFPLMILYIVILFAYVCKILITSTRPEGVVTRMSLGYVICGLVTYLLLYPEKKNHAWIRWYDRIFFASLILIAGLIVAAVWQRVSAYGITQPRYMIIVIALWLVTNAVWYNRRDHIGFIPVSAVVLLLVSSYGPWSSASVSFASQYSRLSAVMERYQMINPDTHMIQAVASGTTVASGDRVVLTETVQYLVREYGSEWFRGLYDQSGYDAIIAMNKKYDSSVKEMILDSMGVKSLSYREYDAPMENNYFSFGFDPAWMQNIQIEGYKTFSMVDANYSYNNTSNPSVQFTRFGNYMRQLQIGTGTSMVSVNLADIVEGIYGKYNRKDVYNVPPFVREKNGVKIIITSIYAQGNKDTRDVTSFNAIILQP